jgi:hypothetical protein
MDTAIPLLFPPRQLGVINQVRKAYPMPVLGNPLVPTDVGGAVQVDGFQNVVSAVETWASPFGDMVQVDGLQNVVSGMETWASPFGDMVQVDGMQAVIVVMET